MFAKNKGKIYLLISAFMYGVAPVLAKFAYEGGANEVTLSFLRAFLAVPVLLIPLRIQKISLKLSKTELKRVIILSAFGCSLSITLLYIAYNFISAGLATTLHFIYPILIIIASAVIYREKISRKKLFSALIVTVGILMFADINSAADKVGIIFAIMSGVFYSFYVLYLDKSGLKNMNFIKLTFYTMIVMSISTFLFGIFTNSIDFSLSGGAWLCAFVISMLVTALAVPLLQLGIRTEGAATAGIMSTLEPITTIVLGAIFLNETMLFSQIIGGLLILSGVVISQIKENK